MSFLIILLSNEYMYDLTSQNQLKITEFIFKTKHKKANVHVYISTSVSHVFIISITCAY